MNRVLQAILVFIMSAIMASGLVSIIAHAQESTTESAPESKAESKAEKLKKLRNAMRGGGSEDAGGKPAPRHPPPKAEPIDMQLRAIEELKQQPSSYSDSAGPSIGVVRTQKIEAKDPVLYSGLQLGVTVQPYAPRGTVPLVTLGARDLSKADSTYMLGLEARYLPWTSTWMGHHGVGFRVGAAYSKQEIALYAPTGVRLPNSQVHGLMSYALLSQAWSINKSPNWSINGDIGITRFDMLVTSSSSLGEASDDIWLGTFRIGPSYRAGDFNFNLNYERRERFTDGWARLAENGVSLGILYGIR